MAKLRIGDAIKFEAHLPLIDKESSGFDVISLVQKTIDSMPKPEVQKEIDLEPLLNKIMNLQDHLDHVESFTSSSIINLCDSRDQIERKIENLDQKSLIIPEIKHITNTIDVSKDVIRELNRSIKESDQMNLYSLKELDLKYTKQLKKQKVINYILSSVLILTIFLHLL